MDILTVEQEAGRKFQGFDAQTTEAEARASFLTRYNAEPELVGVALGGIVKAGPVPATVEVTV